MTLGSLFDGSGGFPLAGSMCGITPVWCSEVEPYPIAVTRSRFPNMIHLGDVSKVNGAEIAPVDIITFGSPCQDLSVAGKRAGLKHESNGDDETTRSGLFMEAIRIIKEMREATNGRYPTFALWENVPGAFSSNGGEDFRIVIQELIKIVEPEAEMPPADKNGWSYADAYVGDGWSIAYRTLDAQYWGVPQRRRRIYLVADFGGERASQILFEREGLRGYFEKGRTPWKAASSYAERSIGSDDRYGEIPDCMTPWDVQSRRIFSDNGKFQSLYAREGGGGGYVAYSVENHPADSRVNIDESGKCQTLTGRMGTGGGNVPMLLQGINGDVAGTLDANYYKGCGLRNGVEREVIIAIDRAYFNQGQNAQYEPQYLTDGTNSTIVAKGPSAVCYSVDQGGGKSACNVTEGQSPTLTCTHGGEPVVCYEQPKIRYIVRRLTPTECARLQGFPDTWGYTDKKDDFTDDEYRFWMNVRNTHASINGKQEKYYGKDQMLKWYNNLHTDSAEYKMWGNGIALPTALYVMQGIAETKNTNNFEN